MSDSVNSVTDWGQRLAIVNAFNLNMKAAAKLFNTTQKELKEAQETVEVDSSFDASPYKEEIEAFSKQATPTKASKAPVKEAAKKEKAPEAAQEDDKGKKIRQAFQEMPTEPTPLEAFQKKHDNVSMHVLRQAKRFDPLFGTDTGGRIRIKLNKESGVKEIWRDVSVAS